MSDRLPPLTALRAFEAAGRHLSFANAAAELNVTPAALSFQIKSLEQHLGQPVFRRLNRAVELTEAGRALLPGAVDGFDTLRAAWRATQRITSGNMVTVTAGPAFTAKWLAPRMFHFAQAHPDVELRFSASLRTMDFDRDEVDVAIRFGLGHDQNLFSREFIDEWLTPMMTPEVAEKVQSEQDLSNAILLHQDETAFRTPPPSWHDWFKAMNMGAPPKGGSQFSQPDHAIDAALTGAGVVLGRISLAIGALSDGSLVAPFPMALRSPAQYRILCPLGAQTRPSIKAFIDWMIAEASTTKDFGAGRTIIDPK